LVLLAMDDFAGVEAAALAGLELRPEMAYANFLLGLSLLKRERFVEAREKLRAAANREPENGEYWSRWLETFSADSKLERADLHAVVEVITAAADDDEDAGLGFVREAIAVGHARVAAKLASDRADDGGASNPRWRLLRCEALLAQGRGDKALAAADRVILEDEELAEAHYLRGRILGDLSRSGNGRQLLKAMAALRRAIDIDPVDGRFSVALAVVLRQRSTSGEHLAVLNTALEVLGSEPAALSIFAAECDRVGFRTFSRKAEDLIE
jgi:tetratricopeptide (TPR) repeat protein